MVALVEFKPNHTQPHQKIYIIYGRQYVLYVIIQNLEGSFQEEKNNNMSVNGYLHAP
jgi:hypothetical protein